MPHQTRISVIKYLQPLPTSKPAQFFFIISTKKTDLIKVKAEEERQELSSDLNTGIFHAPSGILELSKPCQDLVLFGSCFAAGP